MKPLPSSSSPLECSCSQSASALIQHSPLYPLVGDSDYFAYFVLQLICIVLLSRTLYFFLHRVGQPFVVNEMLSGVFLGLSATVKGALFPSQTLAPLVVLSNLGVVFYMFIVGVHVDLNKLRSASRTITAVVLLGLIPPLLCFLFAYPLRGEAGPGVSYGVFALFFAIITSISAFPVLARILGELHLLGTTFGASVLGATAIDDLITWPIVAIGAALANAKTGLAIALLPLWVVLLALWVIFVLRPLFALVGRRVQHLAADELPNWALAIVVALTLLTSMAAELSGLTAVLGAFVMGTVIPRQGPLAESLRVRLEDATLVLLLPVFFAYSGTRASFGAITSFSEAIFILLYLLLVAIFVKFSGITVAARLTGMTWIESFAFSTLMTAKGMVALIALNVALDSGAISQKLYSLGILMAIAATMLVTPVAKLMLGTSHWRRALAATVWSLGALPSAVSVPQHSFLLVIDYQSISPWLLWTSSLLDDGARLLGLRLIPVSDRPSEVLSIPASTSASTPSHRPFPSSSGSTTSASSPSPSASKSARPRIRSRTHMFLMGTEYHSVLQTQLPVVSAVTPDALQSILAAVEPFPQAVVLVSPQYCQSETGSGRQSILAAGHPVGVVIAPVDPQESADTSLSSSSDGRRSGALAPPPTLLALAQHRVVFAFKRPSSSFSEPSFPNPAPLNTQSSSTPDVVPSVGSGLTQWRNATWTLLSSTVGAYTQNDFDLVIDTINNYTPTSAKSILSTPAARKPLLVAKQDSSSSIAVQQQQSVSASPSGVQEQPPSKPSSNFDQSHTEAATSPSDRQAVNNAAEPYSAATVTIIPSSGLTAQALPGPHLSTGDASLSSSVGNHNITSSMASSSVNDNAASLPTEDPVLLLPHSSSQLLLPKTQPPMSRSLSSTSSLDGSGAGQTWPQDVAALILVQVDSETDSPHALAFANRLAHSQPLCVLLLFPAQPVPAAA